MLKHFAFLLLALLVWNWSGCLDEMETPEVRFDSISSYEKHAVLPVAEIQSAEIDGQEEEQEVSTDFNSGLHRNPAWQFVWNDVYRERKIFSGHFQIPILLKSCCLLM